jgi:hypothetical protein
MLGQFGGTPLWELPATAAFGTAPVTAWVAIRYTVSYSVNKISHTKYFLNIIVLAQRFYLKRNFDSTND